MPFTKWAYDFEGPFADPAALKVEPGLFVIWCESKETWRVLDLDEAENVRAAMDQPKRKTCWHENCGGNLYYSVMYAKDMPERRRKRIEAEIRRYENPPCGASDGARAGE